MKELCLFGILTAASVTDIKKRIVPGWTIIAAALCIVIDFKLINLAGVIAAVPFFIAALVKPNSIGGGDIKITAVLGMAVGIWKIMLTTMTGLAVVVVFALIEKLFGRDCKAVPLVPFITAGFILTWILEEII